MYNKYWYRVCWYDADDQEHYYAGTSNYQDANRFMHKALWNMPGCKRVKLFKNDSYIMEVRKNTVYKDVD